MQGVIERRLHRHRDQHGQGADIERLRVQFRFHRQAAGTRMHLCLTGHSTGMRHAACYEASSKLHDISGLTKLSASLQCEGIVCLHQQVLLHAYPQILACFTDHLH